MSLANLPVSADTTLTTQKEEGVFRFAVIGDAHLVNGTEDTRRGYPELKNGLEKLSAYEMDLLAMNGDMIEFQSSIVEGPYDTLNSLLLENFPETPKFWAVGNHEFMISDTNETTTEQALEMFETKTGQDRNYHTTVDGYHFITAAGDNYLSTMSEETITWLTDELTKALAADETKPVFLMLHHPIHETFRGSDTAANTKYSVEFKNFLNNYPRIINLSAHTHTALQNPRAIWQDGFTAIQTGYMGGASVNGDSYDVAAKKDASQAMIIETENSIVTVYKIDLLSGNTIGEPWVIDTSDKNTFKYTNANYAVTANPTFDGEVVLDEVADTRVTVRFPKATCVTTGDNQDGFVSGYRIIVKNAQGTEVYNKTYQSDYYAQSPAESFVYEISSLSRNTDYTVEVYAINPLGGVSEPITKAFKTTNIKTYKTTLSSASYLGPTSAVSERKVTVDDAGVYAITMNFASKTPAQVKASVKGKNNASVVTFAGYDESKVFASRATSTQYLYLDAGENTLLLRNNNKGINDQYNNWPAWNYLILTHMPDKTTSDLTINLEAESYTEGIPDAVTDVASDSSEKKVKQNAGTTLAYTVNVPQDGQYEIYANTRNTDTTKTAKGTVSCNGKEEAFSYTFSSDWYADVNLGAFNLDAGDNTFSITVSQALLETDYFLIKRVGERAYQTHYDITNGSAYMGGNSGLGNDLTVNVERAGVYALSMNLKESTSGGRIKATTNGQIIDYKFSNGDVTDYVEHNNTGYFYLNKGENTIHIQNNSVNDNTAYDYWAACDKLELDYVADKTKADCIWLTEGETALEAETNGTATDGNATLVNLGSGETATFTVTVPQDGQYKMMVRAKKYWVSGYTSTVSGVVTAAGKETTYTAEYPSGNYQYLNDFEAATLNLLEGTNTITMVVNNAQGLDIDYFTLQRTGEYIYETHYEHIYNGGEWLVDSSGTLKEITFDIEKEGVYRVSMSVNTSSIARVKATTNGQIVDYKFDVSNGAYTSGNYVENTGYFYLNKGENTICIVNNRRDDTSLHDWMKINGLKLDYASDKTKADCVWLTEAESKTSGSGTIENTRHISAVVLNGAQNAVIPVYAPEAGKYTLSVSARNPWGSASQTIYLTHNGVKTTHVLGYESTKPYREFELGTFDLAEGVNNITVEKTSSYIVIDYLMVESYIEAVVTIKSFADKEAVINSTTQRTATVIFAQYDGKKLVNTDIRINETLNVGDNDFTTTLTGDTIKVMVWKDLASAQPLCNAK